MRLLVCGGRHFGDSSRLHVKYTPAWSAAWARDCRDTGDLLSALDELQPHIEMMIFGDARGADAIAFRWAKEERVPYLPPFKPDWSDLSHPDAVIKKRPNGTKYDAKAGPRRNARMLTEGRPTLVLACAGGKSTASMVDLARAAGVEVREL